MRKLKRSAVAATAVAFIAVGVGACGSSSHPASKGPTATAASVSHSSSTSGPGFTTPTKGSGSKVKGGTVYFSEAPGSPPNYIFPMYAPQYCGINNIDELNIVLYRPLYWYGNNYSPAVDYNESVGKTPAVSNGGKTYTIKLNTYKWSDGETVNADQLVFWMNMLEASPATEWCGAVPGLFPFNVKSYKALNASTFQITMKKAYNPTWMLYNELSQIYPLPLAWDKTSLTAPTPKKFAGSIGSTVKGAGKVYDFLTKQGADTATWGSSPLWSVVDGPFKVQSYSTSGELTMVANPDYSGTPKPTISKFVELPFTSDTSLFNEIKSGGPSALTVTNLPAQYVPQASSVSSEGYTINKAASYSVNFFPLNFQNPTVGKVFSQLYFRQAFQHLIDQPGWISAILHGTAVPTYGPVPTSPPSPLVSAGSGGNPYPFSISAAKSLLTANGWKVVPGGSTTCVKPGTAKGDCGAGITSGEKIAFNLDYQSGVVANASEMQDLQSNAKQVGIQISLTTHNFDQVYSTAVHCTSSEPKCKWTAENWGAGWIYGPDYYPTGEDLFAAGSVANYSNYDDPTMNKLIAETETAPASAEKKDMAAFVKYTETQLPVVFEPTSIGTFGASAGTLISKKLGGYTANALGFLTPEYWYLTK
jgi:peptide/nickel transport system substrate-binding protein